MLVAEGSIQLSDLDKITLKNEGYDPNEVSKWKNQKDVDKFTDFKEYAKDFLNFKKLQS